MIVEAYVYAATGRKKDALNFARDAVNLNPGAADAHYAYFMAALDPRDADRELAAALALAPFQLGPIHDYAVRIALSKRTDRFELALNLTDFLLKRDPNHVNTKLTQALLYLQTGKIQDAEAVLGAITRRDKAPDMLMALATYWEVKGNTNFSGRYLEEARKADAARFERQAPDNPLELLRQLNRVYYYRNGYFLSLSTLFPDSTQTAAAP
jgi:predicted Zn-dependent protease